MLYYHAMPVFYIDLKIPPYGRHACILLLLWQHNAIDCKNFCCLGRKNIMIKAGNFTKVVQFWVYITLQILLKLVLAWHNFVLSMTLIKIVLQWL